MTQEKNDVKLLEIKDLEVRYRSGGRSVHAVNGVSLSVDRGEILGLVGETGAGKTTIAKSILRILPDHATQSVSGEILFEGEDLLKAKKNRMTAIRGYKISMIFQDPMTALNPIMPVNKQIAEDIQLHMGVSKREAIERANQMLETVGISADRGGEYPHQFSGGMKQRVVIAMALACRPDLLLADEPTTALDVTIQAQVLELIANLQKELKTAMILITHDLGVVAGVCDKVAVVYAGEILEWGTKEEIFDYPKHPYTKGLFGALPDLSKKVRRLSSIDGLPPDPTNLPPGCPFAPRCQKATDECREGTIELSELNPDHRVRCIHID
ncbi:MAG: ABC transporter ATP-binding protein [Solobacterium sp.]|nr:ABC transporter ATP-binding protein [Solobacterium sp.]